MKIRVSIFEDNTSLLEGLAQLINNTEDFVCAGAFSDCNNLIKDIEQSKPDVVLMDIGLPDINGIEGVRIIKKEFPAIRILMQTIFEDREKIFQSICAGASGYILKNTSAARILESIREVYQGGAPISPSVATKLLQIVKLSTKEVKKDSFDLTDREKQILVCLEKGMSYQLIGNECFISIDTVRGHIRSIYDKLHVHSKTAAVVKALKHRII